MILQLTLSVGVATLALIAAIFLLIHVNKNQLSKWYRVAAIALIVHCILIMLWSAGGCCRMMHHRRMMEMNGCEMGGPRMNMMYMNENMGGCCEEQMMGCGEGMMGHGMHRQMMMHRGMCNIEMERCGNMNEEGCCGKEMEKCGKGDKEECMHKCEHDSIKKEVFIKKEVKK